MKNNYLTPITIDSAINQRISELQKFQTKFINDLEKYPKGKIRFIQNHGVTQYFLRTDDSDTNGAYLPKKNSQIINLYIKKWYAEKALILITSELSILSQIAQKSYLLNNRIRDLYSNAPAEIKNQISPIDISDEDFIKEWLSIPYTRKKIPDNATIYTSENNEQVRSKSELNIANALKHSGIPYKYECPLTLKNGITVYPDFTILSLPQRKIIYWEHRGMMDDRSYVNGTVKKTKEYIRSGIFPGDSLIISEESLSSPLGTDEIHQIIDYILSK